MTRIFAAACTLILFLAFTPSKTQADPIVITNGSITVFAFPAVPVYSLSGNTFHATGIAPPGLIPIRSLCSPCASGSLVFVSASFAGFNLDGSQNLAFSFVGPPITIPFSLTNQTVTSPFDFSGTLTGPAAPTFSLIGSGTARFNLLFNGLNSEGVPTFTFQSITYQFEAPEPMSILLLGGGLAALGAGLRLRYRRPL
jgi:hypothetical protein